ncbi:MAG: ArsR/SmtB family transcription factor [Acidimicrobiales bacterium]
MPNAVEPVEAQRLAAQLAVLAESHRLLVLSELQGGPRSAGSLARAIGMAPSLASHHLAVLLKADLVSRWREGSFVYYTLNRKRMTDLNQELARLARPPSRAGRNTHDEPGARAG